MLSPLSFLSRHIVVQLTKWGFLSRALPSQGKFLWVCTSLKLNPLRMVKKTWSISTYMTVYLITMSLPPFERKISSSTRLTFSEISPPSCPIPLLICKVHPQASPNMWKEGSQPYNQTQRQGPPNMWFPLLENTHFSPYLSLILKSLRNTSKPNLDTPIASC